MRKELAREGFPEPEISSESFFFITFKRVYNLMLLNRQPVPPRTTFWRGSEKSREKSREKIVGILRQNPAITMGDLANEIGISTKGIEKNLKQLRVLKIIRRVGSDRSGHWEVLE